MHGGCAVYIPVVRGSFKSPSSSYGLARRRRVINSRRCGGGGFRRVINSSSSSSSSPCSLVGPALNLSPRNRREQTDAAPQPPPPAGPLARRHRRRRRRGNALPATVTKTFRRRGRSSALGAATPLLRFARWLLARVTRFRREPIACGWMLLKCVSISLHFACPVRRWLLFVVFRRL